MKIPYLAVKWENSNKSNKLAAPAGPDEPAEDKKADKLKPEVSYSNQVNMHPPANKLIRAIIDLVNHYKWEYVTILYQETTGPERIEDLIRLPYSNFINNKKFRLQVRQLSSDIDKWIFLIKEVKLSGSSHIIVDIETKNLNKFTKIVSKLCCL